MTRHTNRQHHESITPMHLSSRDYDPCQDGHSDDTYYPAGSSIRHCRRCGKQVNPRGRDIMSEINEALEKMRYGP